VAQRGPGSGVLVVRSAWSVGERPVKLSAKEYELLVALAGEPTRVFTRAELLRSVWGYRSPSRRLNSHAVRLRQNLAGEGQPKLVITCGASATGFAIPRGGRRARPRRLR
jgi:DNA-binding response OmpR family regulator